MLVSQLIVDGSLLSFWFKRHHGLLQQLLRLSGKLLKEPQAGYHVYPKLLRYAKVTSSLLWFRGGSHSAASITFLSTCPSHTKLYGLRQ